MGEKLKAISHSSELPRWFRIESYAITETWTIHTWALQLTYRAALKASQESVIAQIELIDLCREWFAEVLKKHPERRAEQFPSFLRFVLKYKLDTDPTVFFANLDSDHKSAEYLLNQIMKNPLIVHGFNKPEGSEGDGNEDADSTISAVDAISMLKKMRLDLEQTTVWELSVAEHLAWNNHIYKAMQDGALFSDSIVSDFTLLSETLPVRNGFLSFRDDASRILCVDLLAPDKKIIDDFQKWLSYTRKSIDQKYPELFTQKTFDKWIKFGVLPYLDLMLWAQDESVTIRQHVLAEALFSKSEEAVDITERLRKNTIPKAEEALKYLPALVRQARLELPA